MSETMRIVKKINSPYACDIKKQTNIMEDLLWIKNNQNEKSCIRCR